MKTTLTLALCMVLCCTCVGVYSKKNMKTELTPRQQSLVVIACLEAKGDTKTLSVAIDQALETGVTVSEIKEALSQLYAYTGFPRSLNALGVLQEVISRRAQADKVTLPGKEADPIDDNFNSLEAGTQVQTRLTGKPFNYSFAPSTDYYLKAHLFGDIFARNNLSYADRELVTIGALSGIEGVEPQLTSHVMNAPNMGLSPNEIRAIPDILKAAVGEKEAYRLRKVIAQNNDEQFDEVPPFNFALGEPNTAYSDYFIGQSYLATLATGNGKLPVNNVTFEPGCRNNWHIHHGFNQILICVSGTGWYQEWGKAAQPLKQGDVVDIPAEVKHWHGATKDGWFQHVVVATPSTNGSTEWLEPVSDQQYNALED